MLVNESGKDIENDEYVNVIVNDIENVDFVDLNKVENHTTENNIQKDNFVVAIHSENEVSANDEHLS